MNDPEIISESALYSWYEYLNEILGVLFFTASVTSLQFGDRSAEVATISLIFLTLLGYSLGNKKEINRHTECLHRYKGRVSLAITCWLKTPVFVFGVLCLSAIANGFKVENLTGCSLQNIFHSYLYLL